MVEYDSCTPDYVMGSLLIDPTVPGVDSHGYWEGKNLEVGYPALTAQNRYHSIVFASDVNARVVPQCEGLGNGKTYGQQQAVRAGRRLQELRGVPVLGEGQENRVS